MIRKAFCLLYPEKEFVFDAKIEFSGRFKPYNANIRKKGNQLKIRLSRKWKGVSEEIFIGLIQDLLYRAFREKDRKATVNIDLYNRFISNIHLATPKTGADAFLESSFSRVNETYFFGLMDKPNLAWGSCSRRTLATYDFHTDTVTVSSLFREHEDVVDYLVYHELLHKKLKFRSRNGRSFHHTPEFRKKEKAFEGMAPVEKKICMILKNKTLKYGLFLSKFRI